MKKVEGKSATKKTRATKEQTDKKPIFVLCPRCELNYIDKREKYCDVCKAELGLIDPSELLPEVDEDEIKYCSICHVNVVEEGEEICFECAKSAQEEEEKGIEAANDDDSGWVIEDDEPTEQEELELAGMEIDDEGYFDEEEEEEEIINDDEDDFPVGTNDDFPVGPDGDDDIFDDDDDDVDF